LESVNIRNELNIPEACPIQNTNIIANYVFVGDEAFGLSKHMLRPYGGRNLTSKKHIFNYRSSLARIGTWNVLSEYCPTNGEFFIGH